MYNNDPNWNKGNESENKNVQGKRKEKLLEDISPADIFGAESPTERDGVISQSGDFVLWIDGMDKICIEKRDGNRIPRRQVNYLQRLDDRGIAPDVFYKPPDRIEIPIDRWLIEDKSNCVWETDEVGDAEDLLPIIAEAI